MTDWFNESGHIHRESFATWSDVDSFIAAEEAKWGEAKRNANSAGAGKVIERVQAALTKVRRTTFNQRQQGQRVLAGVDYLVSQLESSGGIGLTTSAMTMPRFEDIENTVSLSAALFDTGFRAGIVTLADVRGSEDLLGALWDVAPGLQKSAKLAELLARERANTRDTLRKELDRLQRQDAQRLDDWEERLDDAKKAYVAWARRRSTRWGRLTRAWDDRHKESERRIRTVEETYRERMGLAAPVAYWKTKAAQHEKAERQARLWVLLYFPISLTGLATTFYLTGSYLIKAATAPVADGAQAFPNAVFIVASAGLASCAGLVFWVGRLLTKLYLSQHHLRQDAQERATMTETYLALIENDAASTDDRQVILNALFRNTPDGIVKEDGGLDPSIAAALGKFLAKP